MTSYERSLYNAWRNPEAYKPKRPRKATQVSTDAEKRLEALKQALLRVCDTVDGNPLYNGGHGISSALIRKLVAESS